MAFTLHSLGHQRLYGLSLPGGGRAGQSLVLLPVRLGQCNVGLSIKRPSRLQLTVAAASVSSSVKVLIQGRHVQVTESIDVYVVTIPVRVKHDPLTCVIRRIHPTRTDCLRLRVSPALLPPMAWFVTCSCAEARLNLFWQALQRLHLLPTVLTSA